MTWKKWRIGFFLAIAFGLLTAGAGLTQGMNWHAFVAVLCTSLVTQLSGYLMKHPVEDVQDTAPTVQINQSFQPSTQPESQPPAEQQGNP